MIIDWAAFTPMTALLGGALIGVSAVLLILFNGRIAGISGIVGGLLTSFKKAEKWRYFFVGSILIAPFVYQVFAPLPTAIINADYITIIAAGLLVGFGSRLGSGCTSGHGVCGLSRLSVRSFVATLCFMASGFITVFIVFHLL